MGELPTGTVTFLFTDIENSTPLWEKHPEEMKAALATHDNTIRKIVESYNAQVIKTTGDGFHIVFTNAVDAVKASLETQLAIKDLKADESAVRVRMGMHTGEAELRDGDYYGSTLNRAARIMSVGYGGQVLISETTLQIAREHLPSNASVLDLGEHQLKGVSTPEKIHQVSTPDLQQKFPELKSRTHASNNLPAQLTTFVGREREIAEAQKKLASARLLTLIGPGGTGKTRLSIKIASNLRDDFKDGVWLVELAPISDPALIVATIAEVFELREVRNIPFINILLDYLRAKDLLLVLDNCEHLVEGSAQVADQLLHECMNIKVIASSREALGIDGETVYRVPSLKDEEATNLFVERATKVESRFKMTEENAPFIAQICSRLDGIPLAIELAAARVKLFTPKQIAERLDDRFKLLTGGSRTALPRQQTLHALIDWSYQSLNEVEQYALRRLAVFSGGWSFEEAEAVIGEMEAMDGLQGLVNKSLVNVEEQDGTSRFRFLETIRQYAMEKLLESGESAESRDLHLEYFLNLTKGGSLGLFSPDAEKFLDIFEEEDENLRSALKWASANHPQKALQLVDQLGNYWTIRDHNIEGINWCKTILENAGHLTGLDKELARVYIVLGWCSVTTGDHKSARAAAEKALVLSQNVNDASTTARAYGVLVLTSVFTGDIETGQWAATVGEAFAREHNLKNELAFLLTTRAQMAITTNTDIVKAKEYAEEASQIAQESNFAWAYSLSRFVLAHVSAATGDVENARKYFEESIELARAIKNKRTVYTNQSELAHFLRKHGEIDEAIQIYTDLVPKWNDLGHRPAMAHEMECIAFILIRKEQPTRAAKLLGAAEALRESINSSMTQIEQLEYADEIKSLRDGMDEKEFDQMWKEGRALTLDKAIELATEEIHA